MKNYIALLSLGKDYGTFRVVTKRVLEQSSAYVECEGRSNSLFLGLLVNISGGASYLEDGALIMESYDLIAERVVKCSLDSINLAQAAMNVSSYYLKKGDVTKAKEYLAVGQKYRGSHYPMYDAELSFTEGRFAFAQRRFKESKSKLITASDEFLESGVYHRALNPINWGIRRLGPFLDSADLHDLVMTNMRISDSLGISDNSAELRLVESLVRMNALKDELELSEHKKTTLVTLVSSLFVIVATLLSILVYRRQTASIKALGTSVVRYRKKATIREKVSTSLQDVKRLGDRIQEGAMGEVNAYNGRQLLDELEQVYPSFMDALKKETAGWSKGDREVLVAVLMGFSATSGSKVLNTTPNSYRVRKSKMLKRLPEPLRETPEAWVERWF